MLRVRNTQQLVVACTRTELCASASLWRESTRSYAFKGPDGRPGFEEAIVVRGPFAGRRGVVSPFKRRRGKNKLSVFFTDAASQETFEVPLRYIRIIFPSLPGYRQDPIPTSVASLDAILGTKETDTVAPSS